MNQPAPEQPALRRVVSRWQLVGLSINDVVGSGIYLLPAAAAALLGAASAWAIALAGLAAGLIVLCYAQAASYFDQPGGAYLYTREAFGKFIGFEVGWMTWLTRIAMAGTLSNALALAVAQLWPAADDGFARAAIITLSLLGLAWLNLIGVRSGTRTSVILVIGKLLPLLFFAVVGVFFMDWSQVARAEAPESGRLREAALLLLFAYAGFENSPSAAGEYKNPQRDLPFALLTMIVTVTFTYVVIQTVALGTLPGLPDSKSPLAEAAGGFAGPAAVWLMTAGAAVSILGTLNNTMLFGPRYLYALALDGAGPRQLTQIHPAFRTPHLAILLQLAVALPLALSGSFVQLALLSVISRLFVYVGTAASLLVLRPRFESRPQALRLPGGPLIPLGAMVVSLTLLAAASWQNLAAGSAALIAGAVVYTFRRRLPTG